MFDTHWGKAARLLAVISSGLLALVLAGCAVPLPFGLGQPAMAGTDLSGTPAPGFTLPNASGQQVSLQQFQGKAVALTFIYTSCPDVCPLITQKFGQAYSRLGADASKVQLLAVTVDPETDTGPRIAQYSRAMGLAGKWQFLTGARQQLEPIWKAYYVSPVSAQQAQLLVQKGPAAAASDPSFAGIHTAGAFVIDAQGKERRLLDADFSVDDLVRDLKALA